MCVYMYILNMRSPLGRGEGYEKVDSWGMIWSYNMKSRGGALSESINIEFLRYFLCETEMTKKKEIIRKK